MRLILRCVNREIEAEAAKLIARFEAHAQQLADEQARRDRRTTSTEPRLELRRPRYWALADGFDPFLVRARSTRIAHSINRAIAGSSYEPRTPFLHSVPKPGGGMRDVSVFQVADNAVSKRLFSQLMRKNRTKLSSRAYAYRDDVSVHDAIQYVHAELLQVPRVFVAEYDFSKFFDNISHEYLWRTLRDRAFLITAREESQIRAFLRSAGRGVQDYLQPPAPRERGVPPGTSISLFLANVAAWELDRALEKLGVSFVRYADDTLIWSEDYAHICKAVDALHEMSGRIGAPINLTKSGGVHLLVRGGPAEMSPVSHVDFLGHRIDTAKLSMKPTVVEKAKARLSRLLYYNLLREPIRGTQAAHRLGRVDRDYVVFIWQARRYLYGDLSERALRRLAARGIPARRFKGLMSFFPLITDEDQLRELDRWLAWRTWLALRKRRRLLASAGLPAPAPHGLYLEDLVSYTRRSVTTGGTLDLRLPSFRRMAKMIRSAAREHGAAVVSRGLKYGYR